jgi:serine/threonine protein kinase
MTVDPANLGSVDPLSVEGIFLVALSKSGSERDAFLGVQCVDSSQRQRVEALLLAYEQAGNFLQKPAVAAEATPIGQYLEQCALPGTLGKLGPYEILEEIGRGGMGVVFRAHDPKLQRIVAVKALAPELARLPSARQRFLREARAAAAVSHPHVVTIFAVEGTEEASLGTERTTLPYLVMECIVGQTLHDKIKRVGALKVEEIVRISRQIAEGLTAAHKRGLIHRDIKPANILLENGVERVKITDFGLARTTSDGGITHTGEILGTPQCMSPEQARGEIVDQRSDLFSLGCVMYTMCTGVSPFRADNMMAVMKKVCENTPTPVSQLNAAIPEWLCSLVHALLEKLPASRIQSAEEVVQCLESQAVANGARTAQKTSDKKIPEYSRQHPGEEVPQWLLTPIIPGLKRLFFSDGQPIMTLIAILIGFLVGVEKDRESVILILPMAGAISMGLLMVLKACLKATWHWLNGKAMILVPLGLFLGGVSRVWLIHTSQSGVGQMEEIARNNAGWLIFPLAITIFWLLNRWFPQLFIQNRSPQPNTSASTFSEVAAGQQSASAAVRPRTPWVILEWVIVATLGIAVLSSLGFATVLILPYLPAPGEITPHATCVIRTPVAENVKYVTIDGKQAILEPGGPGEWRTTTAPGTHGIYVAYDSDSMLNQERFFTTTVTAERGKASIIAAEPVMVRSLTRPLGVQVPANTNSPPVTTVFVIRTPVAENVKYVTVDGKRAVLEPGGPGEWRVKTTSGIREVYVAYDSDSMLNQERFFTTTASIDPVRTKIIMAEPVMVRPLTRPSGVQVPANANSPPVTTVVANVSSSPSSPSNPLADAVEVLTDPSKMPEYSGEIVGFSEPKVRVWIDEPGLIISLKRLDFEGPVDSALMYDSRNSWGVDSFREARTGKPAEVPPGRYQVLVQDLDYGWSVDQRGTIQIGNGVQTVHVRRRFHEFKPDGDGFPVQFRWAANSYQITNAEQIAAINGYLALLSGKTDTATADPKPLFDGHPLFDQVATRELHGGWALAYLPPRVSVKLEGSNTEIEFRHSLGTVRWSHSVPEGFTVPGEGISCHVVYQDFRWLDVQRISLQVDPFSEAPIVVPPLSRNVIKEAVLTTDVSYQGFPRLLWFRRLETYISPPAIPAARRLILAWLDGQPDVPEADLLETVRESYGDAATWENLWRFGAADHHLMTAILEPGSTPGTWRIKEPPEGALAPN